MTKSESSFGGIDIPIVTDVVNDIGDAVSSAADAIGDALKAVSDNPFSQFLITAFSTSLYYALAGPFGPQLAAVVFALPGMAKGDDFAKAWTTAFIDRVNQTIKVLSAGQANIPFLNDLSQNVAQYSQQLYSLIPKDAIDSIGDTVSQFIGSANTTLGNANADLSGIYTSLQKIPLAGQYLPDYAKLMKGGSQAAAMFAKAQLYKIIPPSTFDINALTGEVTTLYNSLEAQLLGVPVLGDNGIPFFPAVGSIGYTNSQTTAFPENTRVTIESAVPATGVTGVYWVTPVPTTENNPGLSGLIAHMWQVAAAPLVKTVLEKYSVQAKPVPVFPQIGAYAYIISAIPPFAVGSRVYINDYQGAPDFVTGGLVQVTDSYDPTKKAIVPKTFLSASPPLVFPAIGSAGYLTSAAGKIGTGEKVIILSTPNTFNQVNIKSASDQSKVTTAQFGQLSKTPTVGSASTTMKGVTVNSPGTPSPTASPNDILLGVLGLGAAGGLIYWGMTRGRK